MLFGNAYLGYTIRWPQELGKSHRKIYEYSALSWPCYVKQHDE